MALAGIGWVKVKMLPFDNKSEFQIILNMPEGSFSGAHHAGCSRDGRQRSATSRRSLITKCMPARSSPYNFNGLVRHYFMRAGPNVADIQVNLLPKHERKRPEPRHRQARPPCASPRSPDRYNARVAVAEVPPGPPVLQTLVAEIYGAERGGASGPRQEGDDASSKSTPGVVDIDWYQRGGPAEGTRFIIDKEKAALHGISAETISQTLRIAVDGQSVDLLHRARRQGGRQHSSSQLPRAMKTTPEELLALRVRSGDANALPEPGSPQVLHAAGAARASW